MRSRSRWRPFVYGVAGLAVGTVVQVYGPRLYPGPVLREAAVWGGIVGLCIGYLPHFVHMGGQITGRENNALNVSVGVGAFLGISAVLILAILGVLWVVSLFLR